jgi:hypothetical protein
MCWLTAVLIPARFKGLLVEVIEVVGVVFLGEGVSCSEAHRARQDGLPRYARSDEEKGFVTFQAQ